MRQFAGRGWPTDPSTDPAVPRQLTFVAVQRAGVTQYREYAWSGSDLLSSTDPETGATTYQYDGNHHVTLRTDAKNQQTKYTYDLNERIETQYYTPTGYLGAPVEVVGERVTYGYDSNPNNPYDYYVSGRLGTVSFSNGSFSYYYDYNQGGRVISNQFQASDGVNTIFNLQANYSWDTQGRMTSMTYPSGPTLNYQYDNVGRLSQITSPNYASPNPNYPATVSATYNGASQLSTLNYGFGSEFTETRGYNSLMQLTDLVTTSPLGTVMNMQYNYNNGTNNGRVASTVDQVLGETVNYTYDMWNRLTAASATNGNWGEQYTFDNFGNLTAKTPTAGSAPPLSLSYNLSTNRPTGGSYDANGNPTPGSNYPGVPGYVWDVENRLVTNQTNVSQATSYTYDPWGRRVWAQTEYGRDQNGNPIPYTGEAYFYGATGQKLETYSFTWGTTFGAGLEGINIYFGGKLLQSKGVWVATDRLGSVRANSNGEVMNYWPYGEERTSTANGREKFGTYTRDALGQDYAMARYYDSGIGAFWTPDPGGISTAKPSNPTSWNRYAYVVGDPINHTDRHGLYLDAQDCINDTEACTDCLPIGSLLEAPPGCDDDGGGGGGDESVAQSAPETPTCAKPWDQSWINAHGPDAADIATGLGLLGVAGEADILGLSAIESGWGHPTFNGSFFGMHGPLPGQTGCVKPKHGKGCVSTFSGFMAAGEAFASKEGGLLKGNPSQTQFATILNGPIAKFGWIQLPDGTYGPNPNYISGLVGVINDLITCINLLDQQ